MFDALAAQPEPSLQLSGLVEVALPRLLAGYREHLAGAAAVREAPVATVLQQIGASQKREIARATSVLQDALQSGAGDGKSAGKRAEFGQVLQRLFEDGRRVFPAARAS